jgi:hypothetical protein
MYNAFTIVCCSCVQVMVISSSSVQWQKQGTVMLLDGEPETPEMDGFTAAEGWKLVRNFAATADGGDYCFPQDQILVVLRGVGNYKELVDEEERWLANLSTTKTYLVWYHHLHTEAHCKKKRDKLKAKMAKE